MPLGRFASAPKLVNLLVVLEVQALLCYHISNQQKDTLKMVKARSLGVGKKRNLWESWYQWNDRPGWEYAGKARVIWGHEVDARTFSIKTNSSRGIIWTFDMQCWAVEQGFFVQRELIRERPVIIGVNRFEPLFSYWEPYATMQEIERRVFQRRPRYGILLDFIKQQDLYGFTGAWDARVMNYTPDLLWYKLHKRQMHDMAKRKAILAANAEKARDEKLVRRARKLIKYGMIEKARNTDGS